MTLGEVGQFVDQLLNEVEKLRVTVGIAETVISYCPYQLFFFLRELDFFFSSSFHCIALFNLTIQIYYEFS